MAIRCEHRLAHLLVHDRAHEVLLDLQFCGCLLTPLCDLLEHLAPPSLDLRHLQDNVLVKLLKRGDLRRQPLLGQQMLALAQGALTSGSAPIFFIELDDQRQRRLGLLQLLIHLPKFLCKVLDSLLGMPDPELTLALRNGPWRRVSRGPGLRRVRPGSKRAPLVLPEFRLRHVELLLRREVLPLQDRQTPAQENKRAQVIAVALEHSERRHQGACPHHQLAGYLGEAARGLADSSLMPPDLVPGAADCGMASGGLIA
mmetsp:Transcript_10063/g.28417  ORF Transcript_10063/g.28417 Transcript_10063/m.28417 type:complete len:257 (-) Transcript_10063:1772-2542(-)